MSRTPSPKTSSSLSALCLRNAKIKVCDKKTGECFELSPEEFNEYESNPDHELDFDDFKSLEIMKAGKMIDYYLKIFKEAYKMKLAVGIVTARDDQKMIYRWLREHVGFKIDKDLIFAVICPTSCLFIPSLQSCSMLDLHTK
jgi:hypothetical protein